MNETLRYIKHSQMRAAMLLLTILTCGLGAIPWLAWEILKGKQRY